MVVVVPGSYSPPASFDSGAFGDFLDLRTAVIELVGNPGIADVFPRLVAMAESKLNRMLRMREQIVGGTVTMVSGRAPLPDNYAEIIGLYAPNGAEYVQQSAQHKHGYWYSIQGGEIVASCIAGTLQIDFYATLPPIGTSIDATNWLLAKYPDVYLYAVGFEAAKYTRDAELASQTKGLMDGAVASAQADDSTARYSRARVRVAGVTP